MIISMLLDSMLQSPKNRSLSSRSLIFLYSKFKGIWHTLVLQEKVGILKDKNASLKKLRSSNEKKKGVSHQFHA